MKRFLATGSLVLASLAIAVALCEIVLRWLGFSAPIWYQPDAQLGWTLRPGIHAMFTREGHALVEVNADGRRDVGVALAKPADVYRIAVLGDSYSEAMQVERDQAFWAQLAPPLQACGFTRGKRVEVLNFGVSGYGTAQQYLALESRAGSYRPDLVILQFTNGNDVRDNSKALDDNPSRPFFIAAGDGTLKLDGSFVSGPDYRKLNSWSHETFRELSDRLHVLQLARAAKNISFVSKAQADGVEQGLEPLVLAPPQDANWENAWRLTETLIAKIDESARRHGARFLVFTVPYAIQVHPDRAVREALQAKLGVPDLFYPDRRIAEFARRAHIDAVTLAPLMQPAAERRHTYFHGFPATGMGRGHWNAEGHRAAAELIARHLCEQR